MGERGPLKLPRHLSPVVTDGNSLADDMKKGAPNTPPGFPNDKRLTELWIEMVPRLDRAGLLSDVDGPTVELALRHFLAARDASDELFDMGAAVPDTAHGRDNGGFKKNPADAVFRSQSAMFLEYVKLMGMAFAARARIPGKKQDDGDDDFFAATGS